MPNKDLAELGRKITMSALAHQEQFIVLAITCKHRLLVTKLKIAFCDHEGNKHPGLNYAGCFYDFCPLCSVVHPPSHALAQAGK